MKHYLKLLATCLITAIIVTIAYVPVLAQVPDEVKEAAMRDLNDFTHVFKSEPEHYGLSEKDVIDNYIYLGEGYEICEISSEFLTRIAENKETPSINKLFVPTGKYIFPVFAGEKNVAIAIVSKSGYRYEMASLGSDTGFAQDISDAKKLIKDKWNITKAIGSDDVKLVYDFYAIGLAVRSKEGEFFIPTKGCTFLNFGRGEIVPVKELADKIIETFLTDTPDKPLIGGGGISVNNTDNKANNTKYYIIAVIGTLLLCVVIVISFGIYKLKNQKVH